MKTIKGGRRPTESSFALCFSCCKYLILLSKMKIVQKDLSNSYDCNKTHLLESFEIDAVVFQNLEVLQHSYSHNILTFKIMINDDEEDPIVVIVHNFNLKNKIELWFTFKVGVWDLYIQKPYDLGVSWIMPVHRYWQAHRFTREFIRKELFCGVLMNGAAQLHSSDSDSGCESAAANDDCLSSHDAILLELI